MTPGVALGVDIVEHHRGRLDSDSVTQLRHQARRRGWFGVPGLPTLVEAVDTRAKSDLAVRLDAQAMSPEAAGHRASVVICTRAFSSRLARAVTLAAGQQLRTGTFEILVVDNGPESDDVRRGVAGLRAQL